LKIVARYLQIMIAVFCLISISLGQSKKLTIEDIFLDEKLAHNGIDNICWYDSEDGFIYTYEDSTINDIYQFDIISLESSVFYSIDNFVFGGAQLEIDQFSINSDRSYLLIRSATERIWRHSREGTYYLVEIESQVITPLSDSNTNLRNAKFSPTGKLVAYARDNNLFVYDIGKGVERKLTKDGSDNIINGQFGWVYEEEFGSADGYRWSPDGKKIAFWRVDQSMLDRFSLIDELLPYPKIQEIAYPKAGGVNPAVKIGVVNIKNGRTRWLDIASDVEFYIPRIEWTKQPDQLAIMRLNRPQNKLELLFGNVIKGNCELIITETDPCWVDITDDWRFLADGSFIWTSERTGYRHAFHFSKAGELINQITTGDWEVNAIEALDEKSGTLYFSGCTDSVLGEYLYSVQLDGTKLEKLTSAHGYHSFDNPKSGKFFIDTYSSNNKPESELLIDSRGQQLFTLIQSEPEWWSDYEFTVPELITINTSDNNTELNARITLPKKFDPSQKYPVIIFGYGGPGSQVVTNKWGGRGYLWRQYLNQEGYICFSIDNRGTGGRGKAFKNLAYGDLGKWLLFDQIEGVKYLHTLPYIAKNRIGIWGWSGGGFMTALCLTAGSEYFQVGVAVAPVTDFRLYDTIWTERYMGLPQENIAGYENASVFNYIDNFSGKLLLLHGTGDDNVHPQNTLKLADSFVKHGKLVDMYLYANQNHSIKGGKSLYNVYSRMARYFQENL